MTIETLKNTLPDYAKDLKLNLASLGMKRCSRTATRRHLHRLRPGGAHSSDHPGDEASFRAGGFHPSADRPPRPPPLSWA